MQERIQEYNVLTRKRIRCRFRRFIQRFSDCRATVCNLKLKYLMSLETLLPSLFLERFQVNNLSGRQVTIVVTGNKGIQWSFARNEEGEEEELKEEEKVSEVRIEWAATSFSILTRFQQTTSMCLRVYAWISAAPLPRPPGATNILRLP